MEDLRTPEGAAATLDIAHGDRSGFNVAVARRHPSARPNKPSVQVGPVPDAISRLAALGRVRITTARTGDCSILYTLAIAHEFTSLRIGP